MKKLKQDSDLLKSHLQVYNETMLEQKRQHEFKEHIIKKHNIDVSHPPEFKGGEKHIMNCNEDYEAYHTFKKNKFFQVQSVAAQQTSKASELIRQIIEKLTAKEELQIMAKHIEQLLPPKQ